MPFVRPNIEEMLGYVPGEQPDGPDVLKLNTNENPYPAPQPVLDSIKDFDPEKLRRYPNPTAREFRELAAQIHNCKPDSIIPVNGGDELLRLAITTYVSPGGTIGVAEPSYSLYPVLASIHGASVHTVPLDENWQRPADFAQQMNRANVTLTFIVNPHAPTGLLTSVADLDAIASNLDSVLLIDEAYIDFVDPALKHNTTDLIHRHPNIIILRTLSKGYSMAGLRFGYGIGNEQLIHPMLEKTRDSYNTDAISQTLATASLKHRDLAAQTWQKVRDERARLTAELASLGFTCPPSQSNFLLATIPDSANTGPESARNIYESLKQRGILIRYFDQNRLHDKLRITIGTPEQNNALIKNLKELL